MMRESLVEGRSVFYRSSGSSMWPLVQPDDACTSHPIQAATAKDGIHSLQKKASEIGVGDIVFCQVQRSQQYYAHMLLGQDQRRTPDQRTQARQESQAHRVGDMKRLILAMCFLTPWGQGVSISKGVRCFAS